MSVTISSEVRRQKAARPSLSVGLAINDREILAAQKLRYRIFAEELGARLPSKVPGVDQDIFDPYCEHLVVRNEDSGEIVGTYRILSPENARAIGNYYSEGEFDLTRLHHLRSRMVEIGRSCVHPDHRTGATITLLWSGLAKGVLRANGCDGDGPREARRARLGLHRVPRARRPRRRSASRRDELRG